VKYIIFTREGCEYCEAAKALLGMNYIEMSGELIHTFVKEGGFQTFPQIFHRGKHIGGYNELLSYRPD
jgi:glutaredoxin